MKRRGVDVHNDLGTGRSLCPRRPFREPDIFTDVHTDCDPSQHHHGNPPTRMEVAAFIEYPVIRQVVLGIGRDQTASGNHRGGIGYFVPAGRHDHRLSGLGIRRVFSNTANDDRQATTLADNLLQRPAVLAKKLRFEQQILRGITGNGQFGKGDKIGAGLPGLPQPAGHPADVPLHVPDRRVHLDHGNSKWPHR